MSIRHKILAGYLSVFLIFVVLGFMALSSMHRMQRSYDDLIVHRAGTVSKTKNLLLAVEYEALMLRTYLLTGSREYQTEFRRQADQVDRRLEELEKDLRTSDEKALFKNLKQTVDGFTEVYAQSIVAVRERRDLTDQEKLTEVVRLTTAQRGTVRGVIAQGQAFIDYQQQLMDEKAKNNARLVNRITTVATVLGLFCLLLGIAAALYISRMIADPVRRIEEQVKRIAAGDLTPQELEVASRDEIGRLARSFGVMLMNLRRLTGRLQATTEEMGNFAADLREKAQEAAAASSHTTAVLNRALSAIEDVCSRAQKLSGVSERTTEQSEYIQETATRVLNQMESTVRIAARASKGVRDLSAALTDVKQIIEFISQFADQADLLARKATDELTVEGNSGQTQGVFVDMAHEIRTRAQEAARTTLDVAGLITAVQEHTREVISSVDEDCRLVGEGRSATRKATEALSGLVKEVREVTAQIKETAESSRDFSAALEGVTSASKAQTALVEGVAKACSMLDDLVVELQEALAALKL
ncbi:MAG: methyl-accepting chemotaxis protein [Bacillota bacterium]